MTGDVPIDPPLVPAHGREGWLSISPRDDEGRAALAGLTREPIPGPQWPDLGAVRRLLPSDFVFDHEAVTLEIDLDIDEHGLVVAAEPVDVPMSRSEFLHALLPGLKLDDPYGPTGTVAQAVALSHIGQHFTPAEMDGVPVPVRGFRVVVSLRATDL
ncbi:MAG TPA: hypothetical protein VE869_14765 [Gemmatimonas sp.]|nr:hypothetical protein [Gemmatimonas sp.]